jgi:hypothetical protein
MKKAVLQQVDELNQAVQEFITCIDSLPDSVFLKKMDNWAPRDVVAHLIGWNLYTIQGCRQLKKRETPFYLIDPGHDFCKINAVSVKENNSKDKKELIKQLNTSAEELKSFLSKITPMGWEADFGITYKGEVVTIKNSVDALISDLVSHKRQIEKWSIKAMQEG